MEKEPLTIKLVKRKKNGKITYILVISSFIILLLSLFTKSSEQIAKLLE